MDNQRRFQSADFDLVNTYFGIDVGHTYDGNRYDRKGVGYTFAQLVWKTSQTRAS